LLNDWTACNKKCGGGLQFQQWMCVPPKNNGRPCMGQDIKTKTCNEQPCPSVNNLLALTQKGNEIAIKPIVKVGAFSSRPQRFERCLIKENDAFINELDQTTNETIKRPIRIVMNNHTISVFKDDSYEDLAYTFDLKHTKFTTLSKSCCFDLSDSGKNLKVCSYDSECDKLTNNWVVTWGKDFKEFKTDCYDGLEADYISSEDELTIKDQVSDDMADVEVQQAKMQTVRVKRQELKKQERTYMEKKRKTQDLGFKVLDKEMELETMIQTEEKEKEDQEEVILQKKIKLEKKKKECLEQSFEEKELDQEFQESKKSALDDEQEIKKIMTKKVEEGRLKLKKRLLDMRKRSQNRKQQLNQELQKVRTQMASEIIFANKNGEIRHCIKGKVDTDFRENYCNTNYMDDFVRNSECRSEDDFCYTCCETEFGANYQAQRDSCYDLCDKKKPNVKTDLPKLGIQEVKKEHNTRATEGWIFTPREKVTQ
jgi:hypothetical protein